MRFEWDERKNQANIRKHGLDFADAADMFSSPMLVRPDTREEYGEERWIGIGFIGNRCAFVAFTREAGENIRVISPRKASNEERKEFEEALQNGLETG